MHVSNTGFADILKGLGSASRSDLLSTSRRMVEKAGILQRTITISASDCDLKFVCELFGMERADACSPLWSLRQDQIVEVPERIVQNLADHAAVFEYDDGIRIRAAALFVPAVAQVQRDLKRKPMDAEGSTSSTSKKRTISKPKLRVFPNFELEAQLQRVEAKEQRTYTIKGTVTYAVSYGYEYMRRNTAAEGPVVLCVEAKERSLLSRAMYELISYMAILRHLHQAQKKKGEKTAVIQGYCTDGHNYKFFYLDDGTLYSSKFLDIRFKDDLKLTYSWIIAQIRSATLAPPACPPRKVESGKSEVPKSFGSGLLGSGYRSSFHDIEVTEDDDESNTVHIPRSLISSIDDVEIIEDDSNDNNIPVGKFLEALLEKAGL